MTELHFHHGRNSGTYIEAPDTTHERLHPHKAAPKSALVDPTTLLPPPQQGDGDIMQRTHDDFRLIRK